MAAVRAYEPPEDVHLSINGEEVSVVDVNSILTNVHPMQDGEASFGGLDILLTESQQKEMGDIKGSVLKAKKNQTRLGGMVISTCEIEPPRRTETYADVKLECRMYDGPGWDE